MKISSRRRFIGNTSKAMIGTSSIFAAKALFTMPAKDIFLHHVYFWLKNPSNADDQKKLVEGLKKLTKIKTIRLFHIGKPAPTDRGVIDRSYSISWLLFFNNKADQDSYQNDPVHLKFVEECSGLWSKVVVYDSVDV